MPLWTRLGKATGSLARGVKPCEKRVQAQKEHGTREHECVQGECEGMHRMRSKEKEAVAVSALSCG